MSPINSMSAIIDGVKSENKFFHMSKVSATGTHQVWSSWMYDLVSPSKRKVFASSSKPPINRSDSLEDRNNFSKLERIHWKIVYAILTVVWASNKCRYYCSLLDSNATLPSARIEHACPSDERCSSPERRRVRWRFASCDGIERTALVRWLWCATDIQWAVAELPSVVPMHYSLRIGSFLRRTRICQSPPAPTLSKRSFSCRMETKWRFLWHSMKSFRWSVLRATCWIWEKRLECFAATHES